MNGVGKLKESIIFRCNNVLPTVNITSAAYGVLSDTRRILDVSTEMQQLVKGRELKLHKSICLNDIFSSDPCPGQPKQLRVKYTLLGFQGNLRVKVNTKDDKLVAGVQVCFLLYM